MNFQRLSWIGLVLLALTACAGAQTPWAGHVSEAERAKTNPYANQPSAVAAGGRLFADHCAQCHGENALGIKKRPSLRTPEVQQAADGEIFWLLRNGALRKGMPSWSSLPEPARWQIITYIKSLGENSPGDGTSPRSRTK
jgi:cytochrome c oxidase cbb3-type subunit II